MNPSTSAAILLAGLLLAGTTHATPVELDGIGLSRDVPCGGKDVSITGNENRIQLTGDCGAVIVYGSDHQVSLETAATLEVSGVGITVEADSVGGLSVDTNRNRVRTAIAGRGQAAVVEVSGAEHELELQFDGPAQVTVDGADNRLQWRGDEPSISSSGVDHVIDRQP